MRSFIVVTTSRIVAFNSSSVESYGLSCNAVRRLEFNNNEHKDRLNDNKRDKMRVSTIQNKSATESTLILSNLHTESDHKFRKNVKIEVTYPQVLNAHR